MNDKNKEDKIKKKDKKKSQNGYRPPGISIAIWIFILLFLLFYFGGTLLTWDQADITYTEFKEQLREENVEKITVRGERIRGEFREAYIPQGAEEETEFSSFRTILPSFDDPQLVALLEESNVIIRAESEETPWIFYLLLFSLPLLLLGLLLMRRMSQGGMMGGMMNVGKTKAKKFKKEDSSIRFDDVAGAEQAKRDLVEIVEYLKDPDKFKELGAKIPKGVLLTGSPGTGKTLLAKATAGEAGVPFFSISGSEFIEMFVGVGAARVRDTFESARKDAPAIIFIDEIDSVGRVRGTGLGGGHDEREQTLNQILSEMDGFDPRESVIVLAATNRPDVLDPALTRPGRFDRQITLDLPHKEARKKILEIHTRNVPLEEDVDLSVIAAQTVGFAGANLENLVNEAALYAGRKNKKKVAMEDFNEARDTIIMGAEREEIIDDEERKVIAYHEAGHALVASLIPGTDPLQKVTIIPRGKSLGVTEQLPEKDKYNYSRQYMLDRIAITLGGRASEQIVFGDVTSGAANDLKQVTEIARRMVTQWGMSDKIGPVAFRSGEQHPFLGKEIAAQKDFSEYTARVIDEEVRNIVSTMEQKAAKLLEGNRSKLDAIAQALLVQETLNAEDIDRIMKEPAV